jgi:putative PIN family toxin of toxin-antitoxin system
MQPLQPHAQKEKPEKNPNNPKVVLDTNVLVSAFISPRGTPAQILSLVLEGKLQTCYNQEIVEEYEEVLSRPEYKFGPTPEQRQAVVNHLKESGLFFDVQPSIFPMPDETDRVFYDVAQIAGAFLVTNNIKHYPKEPMIFTPHEFVETFINPSDKTDLSLMRQYSQRRSR